MRRSLLVLALLAAALGGGQWLASRPPAWLDEDPLTHPLGRTLDATDDSEESAAAEAPEVAFPIDLNRADAATLEALPGVGPVLAARIVAARDSLGAFQSGRELLSVKGIGPATLRRIAPLVRFGGEGPDPARAEGKAPK